MKEQTREFARACYDDNTATELAKALAYGPDTIDMETWGLTEEQWRIAVSHALAAQHTGDLDYL